MAGGPRSAQAGRGWVTATEPAHVPSQGPQSIFSGANRSSQKAQKRFLRSFVIVSFRAFPLRARTLPEVNVLPNQSAAAAGNRVPPPHTHTPPRRLVGAFLLPPFHGSPAWLLLRLPAQVPRPPSTLGAWPRKAPRARLEGRRAREAGPQGGRRSSGARRNV